MFMKDLETLGKKHELLHLWTSVVLKWAYKYYRWMDDNDIYVVTMCECLNITPTTNLLTLTQPTVLNPTIQYSWIEKHWEGKYPAKAKKNDIECRKYSIITPYLSPITAICYTDELVPQDHVDIDVDDRIHI